MKRWLRLLIAGFLAILVFAATYPDTFDAEGAVEIVPLLVICALSIFPFLVICIFAGRGPTTEGIAWGLLLFGVVGAFFR